eukprot:465329-Prorocentrum_lima.AAC.1
MGPDQSAQLGALAATSPHPLHPPGSRGPASWGCRQGRSTWATVWVLQLLRGGMELLNDPAPCVKDTLLGEHGVHAYEP